MTFDASLYHAQQLDAQDPLRNFRSEFRIPEDKGRPLVYFLGNSLGLQPKRTAGYLRQIMDDWARYGVESFFEASEPWMDYHNQLTPGLSTIMGCQPQELTVMNNLTVNLHLMLVTFYRPEGKRFKILCEANAFPSDQYMLETHVRHRGYDPSDAIIEVAPRPGEHTLRIEDILEQIERHRHELALVIFGGIQYYTGQVMPMEAITRAGQAAGAYVGFDLAHAAGNIPLQLHNWNLDFACWCSYKYLNSGPGGVAGAFIHERHHNNPSLHRYAGWWGYDKATRFRMEPGFQPAAGAEGWQLGTPPLLLYASHRAALDVVAEAGWDRIQEKREQLTAWLWNVLEEVNRSQNEPVIDFITPRDPAGHGCQVSMHMRQRGREIYDRLMQAGFFVDWREPSVIRLAPVPLYNTFEEVWSFGDALKRVVHA
ncbi:MAG TPA: kynureninase [Lacibacter sp.]|nr:kynureninase [Lacibacter sp.]HMO87550.1 kynureninase [Lacibacter sp.]